MRIVRWQSQERVDLPDMTAVNFLVLGEFRKTIRDLITGFDGTSGKVVLRGFEVEPSAVPDARIRIRMDDGDPDRIGGALLSENLGANTEFGQLTGGEDSAAALEGQAQQIIDFTGQPADTYFIEIRFTYGTGANDNRAFWNPGVNSEFIASQDTRHEPQWEAQAVGSVTGGEWMVLGAVVWDGVGPITTSEITDSRRFLFEGVAGFFEESAQDDSSTSAPDFDRSATRGVKTVTVDSVVKAIRACFRQIRDIKGPDASGNWNWWNRPFAPIDYANVPLPTEQTKHLASVDVVSYTVGDGVDTFGDFNGATGLKDCLDAIDGNVPANGRPRRIKIVIKAGNRQSVDFIVDAVYDFTADGDLHLEIEAASADDASGDKGRARIEFDGALLGTNFQFLQARGLTLKNLDVLASSAQQGLFSVEECNIYNCELQMQTDAGDLSAGNYVLDINRSGVGEVRIIDSDLQGGAVRILDSNSDFTTAFNRTFAAYIRGCTFGPSAPLILNDIVDASGTDTTRSSAGLIVEGCSFSQSATPQTGYVGIVDGRIAENVTFRDCEFVATTREADIIHMGTGAGAGTRPEANWLIDNCLFDIGFTRTSAVDAGLNGTDGTGWALYHTSASSIVAEDESKILIRGCTVRGDGAGTSVDSGAFFTAGVARFQVESCHFQAFSSGAGGRCHIIQIQSPGGAIVGRQVSIDRCHFDKFEDGTGTSVVSCIFNNAYHGVRISDCNFIGLDEARATVTMSQATSAAIIMQSANHWEIHDCHFEGFLEIDSTVLVEPTAGSGCRFFKIHGCTFDEVGSATAGSFAIDAGQNAIEGGSICNNVILTGANGAGIDVTDTADMVVNDNNVQAAASGDAVGIQWGTGTATSMCIGNRVNGQTIAGGGGGVIWGFQNTPAAINDHGNFFP